jgi:hypothetical protein
MKQGKRGGWNQGKEESQEGEKMRGGAGGGGITKLRKSFKGKNRRECKRGRNGVAGEGGGATRSEPLHHPEYLGLPLPPFLELPTTN